MMPSLGSTIRAARLGYKWSARHGAFIRISTVGDRNVIELAPAKAIPSKTATKQHRIWWETPALLDMIPWLRGVREIKRYVCVEVDDAGEITKAVTKAEDGK